MKFRMTNSSNPSFFIIAIMILLVFSINSYGDDPVDISSETPLPDLFTGTLSYSIPIKVPFGRKGMNPSLILLYRSANRNGFLGMGWELETGSIEVKNPLRASGVIPIFTYRRTGSAQDLTSIGTGQYAPVVETGEFNNIIQLTSPVDQQPYWEVINKAGTVFRFGYTSASRQDNSTNSGNIAKWCLDRVTDPNGNFMTCTYYKDGGQIYLDEVDYTGNGAIAPSNSVKFIRESRSDIQTMFSTGFSVKTQYRVKAIDVIANGNRVRRYNLHYDPSSVTLRSILTSIQEYGSDVLLDSNGNVTSGTSFPPITLGYQATDASGHSTGWQLSTWSSTGVSLPLYNHCIQGDYDGDGKTDLACWTGSNNWSVAWSTGNSWSFQNYTLTQELTLNSPITSQCTAGNLYALGKTAIACYPGSGSTWYPFYTINGGQNFGEGPAIYNALSPSTLPIGKYCVTGGFRLGGQTDIACYYNLSGPPGNLPEWFWQDMHVYDEYYDNSFFQTTALSEPAPSNPVGNQCFVGNFTGSGNDDIACYNGSGNWNVAGGTWPGLVLSSSYNAGAQCVTGDFNGDGVTDIACYTGGSPYNWTIMQSTGSGWTNLVLSGPTLLSLSQASVAAQCVTGDFNGDGRTDLACYAPSSANWSMALSTSTGFWQAATWNGPILQSPAQTPLFGQCVVGDLDGDGKTDLACLVNGSWSVAISNEFQTDLLSSVSNGIGSRVDIQYTPSTAYQNTLLPFPIQTVSQITACDNYSSTPGCLGNSSVSNYSYSGGVYYVPTHDFRGFNYAKVTGSQGANGEQTVTETWFHQGNDLTVDTNNPLGNVGYMKGKPYRVRVSDGQGNKISETTTLYAASPTYWGNIAKTYAWNPPFFNPPQEVDVSMYDGGTFPNKQTKTVYTYDSYGNAVEEDRYGDINDSTDDRTVARIYSYNTNQWIVGLPASENIYQGIGTTAQVAGKTYYYDDLTACNGTPTNNQTPINGNLTRVVNWNNGTASNGGANTEIRMVYGPYGNLSCTRDANANAPTTITYDSTYTFPRVTTNPLNQQTTTIYYGVDGMGVNGPFVSNNGQYGQVKSVTDPNLFVTSMQYDQLGRQIQKTEPDGFWTSWSYPATGASNNQPGVIGSQHIQTTNSLGLWSAAYFDGLGRTYMQKKSGPANQTIVNLKSYDARGAVASSSFPYFDGVETPRYVTYTHDSQGRITKVIKPDNTMSMSCYSFPVKVTIDENGHRKRQITDVYGRLVAAEEYQGVYPSCTTDEGTPYAATSYTYDVLGNLRFITDTKQNQSEFGYDSLGRKSFINDSDLGVWNYVYDANGNLTLQADAKGQKIAFGYDALNRLVWKDYGADNSHEITYTYDEPTSAYPTGHLTTMADLSGTTKYYYDAYRTVRTTKTVDGTSYTTTATYDGLNRVANLTYPDNETVSYVYDSTGGNLSQITGYVSYAGYNAFGQPGNVTFGNGVTTNYTYDSLNNRLNSIITRTPSQAIVVNLGYDYDSKGNIQSVSDLVNSFIPQTVNGQNYSLYSGKAHAFGVTGTNFQYDANGSMTADGQRTMAYNYDNMPTVVTTGGGNTSFVYDGNLKRVKKISPDGTVTVYIDKFYECEGGTCVKYIFADGKRIALKNTNKTLYYHPDLQGTTAAITDASGTPKDNIAYYPFGATWSETGTEPVNHKYTSQELDAETGLYNYGARLYDPYSGRFVTPDNIVPDFANPQSLNKYAYALNNPIQYADPTGHSVKSCIYGGCSTGANIGAVVTLFVPGAEEFAPVFKWGGMSFSALAINNAIAEHKAHTMTDEEYKSVLVSEGANVGIGLTGTFAGLFKGLKAAGESLEELWTFVSLPLSVRSTGSDIVTTYNGSSSQTNPFDQSVWQGSDQSTSLSSFVSQESSMSLSAQGAETGTEPSITTTVSTSTADPTATPQTTGSGTSNTTPAPAAPPPTTSPTPTKPPSDPDPDPEDPDE